MILNAQLIIYPNPNNGQFTILIPDDFRDQFILRISDLSGRIIFLQRYDNQKVNKQVEINITGRTKGTLLVQLLGENGKKKTGKILID